MKQFAKAVQLTAKIREKSYDTEASNQAILLETPEIIDFSKFYKKTIKESAIEAVEELGLSKTTIHPIYLLLSYCWNDILDWAEVIK